MIEKYITISDLKINVIDLTRKLIVYVYVTLDAECNLTRIRNFPQIMYLFEWHHTCIKCRNKIM